MNPIKKWEKKTHPKATSPNTNQGARESQFSPKTRKTGWNWQCDMVQDMPCCEIEVTPRCMNTTCGTQRRRSWFTTCVNARVLIWDCLGKLVYFRTDGPTRGCWGVEEGVLNSGRGSGRKHPLITLPMRRLRQPQARSYWRGTECSTG